MSGLEFVKLTEKNDHEAETWVHWLQYTGNEEEIAKLDALFKQWRADSEYDLDYTLDLGVRAPEDKVDFAVEHAPDEGRYGPIFSKHTGTFTCPKDPGLQEDPEVWEDPNTKREDLFYKGNIARYFSA